MSNLGFFQFRFKRRAFEKKSMEATGSWHFHLDAGWLPQPLLDPASREPGGRENSELERQGRSGWL